MSIQNNLKKLRTAKGVTQRAMADFIGIHEMSYNRLENDAKKIDATYLFKASKLLGVDISIFFSDELTDNVIRELKKIPC